MTTTIFWPCNMSEKAGRRIRTDDLLITNQLLYQLSYAGILRAERPPSAAISVLTVYAIFYGMPVGTMEHGHRAKRKTRTQQPPRMPRRAFANGLETDG